VLTTAYTMAEVAERNEAADCWTVIDDRVFDLTDWIARHPGGAGPIESLCGRDGTSTFNAQHQDQPRPTTQLDAFVIGVLQ
jgi:cytochrome b involved in lipid metabolism